MTSLPNPTPPPVEAAGAAEAGAADLSAHLSPAAPGAGWRAIDRLVSVAFVVALALPGIALLAGARPEAIENRPLLAPPTVTVEGLGNPAWYASVDRFIADNLVLKRPAVALKAGLYFDLLGQSTTSEVVVGRDGWLFLRTEFVGACRYTALDELAGADAVEADLAAHGQRLRVVVAPNKQSIYPDRLSPVIRPGRTCADLERPAMQAGMAARPWAVDGWAAVLAARDASRAADPVYFPEDSHWKPGGALSVIRAIVESVQPGTWRDADVRADGTLVRELDLARLLGFSRSEPFPHYLVRRNTTVESRTIPVRERLRGSPTIIEYRAQGSDPLIPGRTVIVYDSFFDIYRDLLAPFFASSTWVHAEDIRVHPEIAAELATFDTVIVERVERRFYAEDVTLLARPFIARDR